tara:strand:- start:1153 stop:1302 length:150 start_codon:yes stop_codon:yes gene_type:complete
LDDKHISPSRVLIDPRENLAVCELLDGGAIRGLANDAPDLGSKRTIRPA